MSKTIDMSFSLSLSLSLPPSLPPSLSLSLSLSLFSYRYLEPPSPSRDGRCWFLRCCCCFPAIFFFAAAADVAAASGLGAERSARKSALVIGLARVGGGGASLVAPSPLPSPPPPPPSLSDMASSRAVGGGKRDGASAAEREKNVTKK